MSKASTIVAPSVLAANWAQLQKEVTDVEAAGADWLHLDVMDGRFVPEITFGAGFVETVNKVSNLPLDVHLMIEEPEKHVERFIKAGANGVTFHIEACSHAYRLAERIQELGGKAGIALNPGTPVEQIQALVPVVDLILLMTVNPGWGGQSFIPSSIEKLSTLREMITKSGRDIVLQVDGGINAETAPQAREAGSNCLVAGTFVFASSDYKAAIDTVRGS